MEVRDGELGVGEEEGMRWTRSNASRSSESVCSSKASRLLLTVPLNNTGSCGMIASRDRKAWSFILEMSRPSI